MLRRAALVLASLVAASGCAPEAPAPVNSAVIANLAEPPPTERNAAQEEAERLKTEGVPAAEIPAPYRGEWIRDVAECRTGATDTRLVVEARALRFHESEGPVERVRIMGEREIVVRARLSGEGETRVEERRMILSPHGEALTVDGYSRRKCRP